jgi:hypothetical protein
LELAALGVEIDSMANDRFDHDNGRFGVNRIGYSNGSGRMNNGNGNGNGNCRMNDTVMVELEMIDLAIWKQ